MNPTTLAEHAAACRLLERFAPVAERRGSPVWLLVRSAEDDPLETCEVTHPEGLLGQVAGPRWDAAAVIGTGRIRNLDPAHEPPAALVPGLAGGLAMACLVTRTGSVGWRMRLPDGTFFEPVPESGFMLDVLRRTLQLPTPPPEVSIAPLELAAWVGALMERAGVTSSPLGWPEALACHPSFSGEDAFGPARAAPDLDRAVTRLLASATTEAWEPMRRLVAAGVPSGLTPSPELAEWMDEGIFSRWVLGGVPELDVLLAAARPCLQPAAVARFCHVARALDDRTSVR